MNFTIEHSRDRIYEVTTWLITNVGEDIERHLGQWYGKGWEIKWTGIEQLDGNNSHTHTYLYDIGIDDPKLATLAMLRFAVSCH